MTRRVYSLLSDYSQLVLPQEAEKDRSVVGAATAVYLSISEDHVSLKADGCVENPDCEDFYTCL